ncbi:MAG: M23 family metallopeptidase [Rhodobacteraceae bacterium]|nr:M23 family metallopeptidase [Paracoccaceae bacterium]
MARAPLSLRTVISVGFLTLTAACSSVSIPGLPGNAINAPANTLPTADRPAADSRGVISYPGYQVAIARSGESIEQLSERLGLPAPQVARTNGLPAGATLRGGEVIVLPSRVAEAAPSNDVATVAGAALDRADSGTPARAADDPGPPVTEPRRHVVQRGESAYSIARLYNVSARSLADWNGLDDTLSVREGQVLLIPVARQTAAAPDPLDTVPPGEGSPTPQPPSAATAQPDEDLPSVAAASAAGATPPAAALNDSRTAASDTTRLLTPVSGRIIRGYDKRQNEGLDFSAPAGSQVIAADAGTVAAITRDVDQVPIVVIRHSNGLLTVYANVDDIKVEKGARVSRGQQIAVVREADQPFLHFEVRQGFDSVDPVPYLTE